MNLTDLTLRALVIITGQVLDKLLCNCRTALIGCPEFEDHVGEGCCGTLEVYAFMLIETLILTVNERIADMLRNLIERDRDSLLLTLNVVNQFELAVLFRFKDIRCAGDLQVLNADRRRVLHVVCDIHGRGDRTDRTCDGKQQEEGKKRGHQDGSDAAENPKDQRSAVSSFLCFLLLSGCF